MISKSMLKNETQLAWCGLACVTCPIHLATLEPDKTVQHSMRESIVAELARIYGMSIQAGGITDCDGCRAENGRLFSGCSECVIRKCTMHHDLENCAYCSQYACDNLIKHYQFDPDSRKRLEEIRQKNKI
jgi:hypothetical protein